jgi:hypothetical protein
MSPSGPNSFSMVGPVPPNQLAPARVSLALSPLFTSSETVWTVTTEVETPSATISAGDGENPTIRNGRGGSPG